MAARVKYRRKHTYRTRSNMVRKFKTLEEDYQYNI